MDMTTTTTLSTQVEQWSTVYNATNATSTVGETPGKMAFKIIIKIVYVIGILGNAIAIIILRRGERRMRNRKHLLLVTSLAVNDLVALVGMLCAMVVSETVAGAGGSRAYCGARVLLRVFGVGSVCIAVTMALERYLALTRPFLYQKQVTYYVIRTWLLVSWAWAAALTCAPIFGLGLYYDEAARRCQRYRNAVTTLDFGYAVFYVIFGTLLCLVLVYCNLAVIRALYAISAGAPAVRRVSKSSCRQRQRSLNSANNLQALHHNAATAEEVAFSRLMAILSVCFMICWLPQMVSTSLYLTGLWRARLEAASPAADALMLLNYVLDPVLYVLWRQRTRLATAPLCHSVLQCFKRGHKSSTESMSMKNSCCPQETLVVSDSSGAELRPLRPPAPLGPTLLKIDD